MGGIEALLADADIVRLRAALDSHQGQSSDEEEGVRKAAVALIFRSGDDTEGTGGPELLFIKRAEYPGDPWSGQVAFPGGREEPGDSSLAVSCSIRSIAIAIHHFPMLQKTFVINKRSHFNC